MNANDEIAIAIDLGSVLLIILWANSLIQLDKNGQSLENLNKYSVAVFHK